MEMEHDDIITISPSFSGEEFEKVETLCFSVVNKIREKLGDCYPFSSFVRGRKFTVQLTTLDSFFSDGEKFYVYRNMGRREQISQAELVERAVKSVRESPEYQPYHANKQLKELNENFVRLFDFLRESVELVPGSNTVSEIQKDFESKM